MAMDLAQMRLVTYPMSNFPDLPASAADPATWMLDISTVSAEERLEQDLADAYASSHLHECAARCHVSNAAVIAPAGIARIPQQRVLK